jgi:small conductance mechanosensitive channel
MNEQIFTLSDVVLAWLATEGLNLATNLLVFFLVILAGVVASRIARRAVKTAFERSRLQPSPLLVRFVLNVVSKGTVLIAMVIALGNLGIDTSALIAGIGVSGLVLGFALRDTLSNFASGLMILLYRPFDEGHFIEINGQTGTVKELTLVSTVLTTPDNKQVNIPNSNVWGNALTNFSATGTRRLDIVAGIAYDADVDEAAAIFMEILLSQENIHEEPAPTVTMRELNDSSVDFNVRGWVDTSEYWPTHAAILREIKYRLDEAGIGIPFPQRDVWVHEVGQAMPGVREKQAAPV